MGLPSVQRNAQKRSQVGNSDGDVGRDARPLEVLPFVVGGVGQRTGDAEDRLFGVVRLVQEQFAEVGVELVDVQVHARLGGVAGDAVMIGGFVGVAHGGVIGVERGEIERHAGLHGVGCAPGRTHHGSLIGLRAVGGGIVEIVVDVFENLLAGGAADVVGFFERNVAGEIDRVAEEHHDPRIEAGPVEARAAFVAFVQFGIEAGLGFGHVFEDGVAARDSLVGQAPHVRRGGMGGGEGSGLEGDQRIAPHQVVGDLVHVHDSRSGELVAFLGPELLEQQGVERHLDLRAVVVPRFGRGIVERVEIQIRAGRAEQCGGRTERDVFR